LGVSGLEDGFFPFYFVKGASSASIQDEKSTSISSPIVLCPIKLFF